MIRHLCWCLGSVGLLPGLNKQYETRQNSPIKKKTQQHPSTKGSDICGVFYLLGLSDILKPHSSLAPAPLPAQRPPLSASSDGGELGGEPLPSASPSSLAALVLTSDLRPCRLGRRFLGYFLLLPAALGYLMGYPLCVMPPPAHLLSFLFFGERARKRRRSGLWQRSDMNGTVGVCESDRNKGQSVSASS